MNPRARQRPEQGFTLIEVMIAVLLTAIAMAGIIALYTSETRASGTARHATEATVLAQDQLERLRTSTAVSSIAPHEVDLTPSGAIVSGVGIFTRQWIVTPSVVGYTDLEVTVGWAEDGVNRAVTLYGRRN